MTDHTAAAQAAMQEGERNAAAHDYFEARREIDSAEARRIFEAGFDRAYPLRSKLRAPVADELPEWEQISANRDRDEALTPLELFVYDNEPAGDDDAWRDQLAAALASAPVADERAALSKYDYQALFDAIGKAVKVHPNLAIEISVQAFRAALASAPVAGEALTRFCPECGLVGDVDSAYWSCCPDGGSARVIPKSLAEKCRANFLLAIKQDSAPQASEAVGDALDAERWRALIGSARIRPLGSAGLEQPDPNHYAHLGLEIWTVYGRDYSPELLKKMDAENERGRRWLVMFADAARAALSAQPGAQKNGDQQC